MNREDDPLVIRRVEMYFHHWVQTLDYSSPNAYLPRAEWEAEVAAREETTRSERSFWTHIRTLAYEDRAETRFNTHTVGYIGADAFFRKPGGGGGGGGNRGGKGGRRRLGRGPICHHDPGPGTHERVEDSLPARAVRPALSEL